MSNSVATEKRAKVIEDKKRTYFGKVAIVGSSGTGKSYLSKTADRKTTGYINIENQPLPYKSEPFLFEGKPKTWAGFMKCLKDYSENPDIHKIILDSQTMAFEKLLREMSIAFTGFDVYKQYNKNVYEYLELMKSINKDMIIISHDELIKLDDGTKVRRMVVHGKEFEGKIERNYVTVLYSGMRVDAKNNPEWYLKTFESDASAKVPEGLFSGAPEIPNSAEFIFKALEEYYS